MRARSFLLGSSAYSALVALNATAVGLLFERDDYSAISYRPIDLKEAQAAHDKQQQPPLLTREDGGFGTFS